MSRPAPRVVATLSTGGQVDLALSSALADELSRTSPTGPRPLLRAAVDEVGTDGWVDLADGGFIRAALILRIDVVEAPVRAPRKVKLPADPSNVERVR